MICPNCNGDIEDGSRFCPKCGARLDPEEETGESRQQETADQARESTAAAAEETEQRKTQPAAENRADDGATGGRKNRTRMIIGIIAAAVVVVAVVVVLIVVLGNGKTAINLDDYVTVTTEGYDGYGTASYTIDDNKLKADYAGKIKLSSEGKNNSMISAELQSVSDPVEWMADRISGSLSEDSDLSNGDQITFTWDVDYTLEAYLNISLKYSDITKTVEDLKPVTQEDFFNYVSVEFSGMGPDGTAALHVDCDWLNTGDFYMDRSAELSNGETVTVTISDSAINDLLQSEGIAPIETSRSYTVEGLSQYINTISEVPDEKLDELKKEAEDHFPEIISYGENKEITNRTINEISFVGCYLVGQLQDYENELFLVYHINTSDTYNGISQTIDYYSFVGFPNVYLKGDGTVGYDPLDNPHCHYTTNLNDQFRSVDGVGFIVDYGDDNFIYRGKETLLDLKSELDTYGDVLDSTLTN